MISSPPISVQMLGVSAKKKKPRTAANNSRVKLTGSRALTSASVMECMKVK